MANYFEPTPNATDAFYTDGTHQWFGKAARGCSETKAGWIICKMEFSGNNWTMKYPVDTTTGKASDAPKFTWGAFGANVTAYTYRELGT